MDKISSNLLTIYDKIDKLFLNVGIITDILDGLRSQQSEKHSIVQELIDEGAYDVAKSYIDFLKAKNIDLKSQMLLASHKSSHSVSPVGKKTMKKNNGAEFGPDTKGTKTSGIQEAINSTFKKPETDEGSKRPGN